MRIVKKLIFVLLILLLVFPNFPVAAANSGLLSLSQSSGKPGDTISIYGSWFNAYEEGWVYLDSNRNMQYDLDELKVTTKADYMGTFSASFKVPNVRAGTFTLKYVGPSGANELSFNVRSNIIGLNPDTGPEGSNVTITGSGFPRYESGNLYLDVDNDGARDSDEPSAFVYADDVGKFTVNMKMPAQIDDGIFYVRYTGPTSMEPAVFRIKNPPPAISLRFASGEPGNTITVNGNYFPRSESGYVYIDVNGNGMKDTNEFYTPVQSDTNRSFTAYLMTTKDMSDGTYKIRYSGVTVVNPVSYEVNSPASISLETSTGRMGNNTITVYGRNIPVNESGYVYLDENRNGIRDSYETYTNTNSDGNGSFIASLQVQDLDAGTYYIQYSGTTFVPKQIYTVLNASVSLSASNGPAGSIVTVNGKNLRSDEVGYVYLDTNNDGSMDSDEVYISTTSDANGSFTGSLTIPYINNGTYNIRYSGATSIKETSYEIKTPAGISLDTTSGERYDTITVSGKHFPSSESG